MKKLLQEYESERIGGTDNIIRRRKEYEYEGKDGKKWVCDDYVMMHAEIRDLKTAEDELLKICLEVRKKFGCDKVCRQNVQMKSNFSNKKGSGKVYAIFPKNMVKLYNQKSKD